MKLTNLILLIVGFLIVMGLVAFVLGKSLYVPIVTFNGGRISPHMEARNDFPKYNASCRTLDNFLITAQGPVSKRPGTEYIATSAETQNVSRIISFTISTDDSYIIEFIDDKMYVYRNGGQVQQ